MMTSHTKSTFLNLVQEFTTSFLISSEGEERVRLYRETVDDRRRMFRELSDAMGRGEDITNQLFNELLPAESRRLIERSGWILLTDMRRAATAIVHFLRRVNRYPEQLADACAEFSSIPYIKGVQSGMLTPAISALRPEECALYNNRVRRVLQHFTGTRVTVALLDYPRANTSVHALIREAGNDIRNAAGNVGLTPLQLFDLFTEWLVSDRRFFRQERKESVGARYWKLSPGEIPGQWEESKQGGFIAMQGEQLGDISAMTRKEFNKRRDALVAGDSRWTRATLNQLWRFARIAVGDRIIVNDGTRNILGTGTVTGSYYFQSDSRYGHRLPVRWDRNPPTQLHRHGWRRTLMELEKNVYDHAVEERQDMRAEREGEVIAEPNDSYGHKEVQEKQPEYTLQECALETGFDIEVLGNWVRAIERKGQAILYGPPGVGKTYVAMRLGKHLVGGGNGFVDIVQFHPAYAYEDFVQGIRPQPGPSGMPEYPMMPGRFLRFCERAESRDGICVMVIDEINRANLPRVFGELMYLLEYRDQEITLAGGRRFRIPTNVRIIGTMNTADRSIALVDHALRRRFAFLELRPSYDVLERYHHEHNPEFNVGGLIGVLKEINRAIGDRHYELGISYFLHPEIEEQIGEIWSTEIESYLDEYFFDQPEKREMFSWKTIKEKIMDSEGKG